MVFYADFWPKNNLCQKHAAFLFWRRVFRMAESETEIFCGLDKKNSKRKSYKGARVSLKSVLNSEKHEEKHINSVEFHVS